MDSMNGKRFTSKVKKGRCLLTKGGKAQGNQEWTVRASDNGRPQ
jgi:hypothetical protein